MIISNKCLWNNSLTKKKKKSPKKYRKISVISAPGYRPIYMYRPDISPPAGMPVLNSAKYCFIVIFFLLENIYHCQCSHQDFSLCGVPGPPLLKKRGPVRTLGGQSYSRSTTAVEKNFYVKYMVFLPWNSSLVFICCTLSSSLPSPPEIPSS